MRAGGLLLLVLAGSAWAQTVELESMSVTAAREERVTQEVPSMVAVVDADRFEDEALMSLKDALHGTPGLLFENTNGSASGRVILRGAGLKARFGVREVMLLRDGVPLTDPDSFTRLDFVNTQDIDRIEVTKGPADLYSPGTTGGAIHIFSKSPFDETGDQIKFGAGSYGYENLHIRKSFQGESDALSATFSYRGSDNDWRRWNETDPTQLSLKHGHFYEGGSVTFTELAYTESNTQLPGNMDTDLFDAFKKTGKQPESSGAWQHSGRYSETIYLNSRSEVDMGDWQLQPKAYYYGWKHFHPVTGRINDTREWVHNVGLELEGSRSHELLGMAASQTLGASLRYTSQKKSDKYAYGAVATEEEYAGWGPPTNTNTVITETLSDKKGDLLSRAEDTHTLYGVFGRQSLRPTDRLLVDLALRVDRSRYKQDQIEYGDYDWGESNYDWYTEAEKSSVSKSYTLIAPKAGVSYRLSDPLTGFVQVAKGDQLPADTELRDNPELETASVVSVETGLKWRSERLLLDASIYQMTLKDEIAQIRESDGITRYINAGETDKKGAELYLNYQATDALALELGYSYTDYSYTDFEEPVRDGALVENIDRSGNQLPYIPRHQYKVGLDMALPAGFSLGLKSVTWSEYYMDNANSEKYEGYEWLTGASLRYEQGDHRVAIAVENLFDERYASEATKGTDGSVTYKAGAPRTAIANYSYRF